MDQSDKLLFPNRIGRVSYAVRYVVFMIVAVGGSVLPQLAGESGSAGTSIAIQIAAIAIMVFALVALFRSVLVPRLRDIGLRGAWSLLIFVPFLNILFVLALLFVPANAFTPNVPSA